ncbi:Ecdysteroid UDP-glucosyltransferase [Temnothorax longispinosus]|uniref:Ecdysteroid UDP-glucosyltransferase n=1 Tax=Temnothorax longispinosus TaxID=300112 RepID=A0A4S2KJM8_9HYME|nr:Ecdysteroid UDP-glucosyltransferase [Temnothorax longispinosus]
MGQLGNQGIFEIYLPKTFYKQRDKNYQADCHQISYRALWLELHRRGHEIVSVTTDPINNSSLTNYTEIDLKYFYNHNFPEYKTLLPYASVTKASLKLQLLEVERRMVWAALHILNREVFKKPEMKKLYAPGSNEHFDAVIVAQGPTVSMNAFAYRFNAPLIEDAIAKEYLGQDLPHIDDITRNMSIYLVNKHPTFLHGKPEQPNVIFYHGFHIAKAPDTLPEFVLIFSLAAHPNIKLFIYQGGQQSTEEAIYYGIPLIGFPIIWDQIYQVQNIVRLGVGIQLQIDNLSNKSIMASIHEVISNKRYKNQMEHLSKLFKDSPYDSLQNAVQWIEYVIRLNGTPFLRNSLGDEPWYQRYDWDIIGFLAIVLFIASLISIWALLQIFRFHLRLLSNSLCHHVVFRALCLALNKRGHELTVITPHPIKDSTLKNYTEIGLDLHEINKYYHLVSQLPMIEFLKFLWKLSHQVSIKIFEDLKFKELYRHDSNEKFDAVILESLGLEQEIVKKYLGNDIPYIVDIMKNMSVMLVNENPILAYPRPEQPNAIFFNGIHIQKTPPSLPKDLGQFLDDAMEGFIYVSFGTTCHDLPKETLKNIVEVFSKLPYKIVWKFDCELPEKLDNAFISEWFLQQGVLGGTQSTEEAVHYAVPILGIPTISEQENRVRRLVSLGAAIYIKFNELTKERLDSAIYQILNDKSYKEKMMYLSSLFKNQPYNSTENLIWWIEFVMRHKGVNHLRFSDSDKPWYQRYDIDIIALLATALFIIECVIALTIIQIIRFTLNNIV